MKRDEQIKSFFEKASINTNSEVDKEILNKLIAIAKHKNKQPSLTLDVGRKFMKSRIKKLAAAAAVIVVILMLIHFTGGPDMASVAWAELADRVVQIQTCVFRGSTQTIIDSNSNNVQEGEMEAFASSEYGFRTNLYMDGKIQMMQYSLLQDKVIVSVMPEQKRYMKIALTDERLEKMRTQGSDPREMVKELMSADYIELGRDTIDGIEVEGIETTDPNVMGGQFDNYVGRLWVDPETQLPVQMEMEMTIKSGGKTVQTSMVMYDFQWDVQIAPDVFEPNIPEDYTSMGGLKLPMQNEASAVEGLRLFAEITDGNYPQSMSMMKISVEVGRIMAEKFKMSGTVDPNREPSEVEQDAMMQEMMRTSMTVGGACMFYVKLIQENKDPAYYGDRVNVDDVDAVLMRWKVSDGIYRVIFGDLTTENVTSEKLAELEASFPEK